MASTVVAPRVIMIEAAKVAITCSACIDMWAPGKKNCFVLRKEAEDF
jgi:hypothetical protein